MYILTFYLLLHEPLFLGCIFYLSIPFIYCATIYLLCNHLFTVQPFIYCATILFTVQPFIYCATIYLSGYTYEHSTIHIIILNKLSLLTL